LVLGRALTRFLVASRASIAFVRHRWTEDLPLQNSTQLLVNTALLAFGWLLARVCLQILREGALAHRPTCFELECQYLVSLQTALRPLLLSSAPVQKIYWFLFEIGQFKCFSDSIYVKHPYSEGVLRSFLDKPSDSRPSSSKPKVVYLRLLWK
jgi:hypothetical protein